MTEVLCASPVRDSGPRVSSTTVSVLAGSDGNPGPTPTLGESRPSGRSRIDEHHDSGDHGDPLRVRRTRQGGTCPVRLGYEPSLLSRCRCIKESFL